MKPSLLTSLLLSALRWLDRLKWWAEVWRKDRLPTDLASLRQCSEWCRAAWTHYKIHLNHVTRARP